MHIVPYLFTLASLQNFKSNSLKDLTVQKGSVSELANQLRKDLVFPIDEFKDTGYVRIGTDAKYISSNLREFIFNHLGSPEDAGSIVTVLFKSAAPSHNEEAPLTLILRRKDIQEDVKQSVDDFIRTSEAKPQYIHLNQLRS